MAATIEKSPSSNPIFRADWPKDLDPSLQSTCRKATTFFFNVLSVIIFPIGICRLIYSHFQNLAYRAAIPGQIEFDCRIETIWDLAKALIRFVVNPENFKADLSKHGHRSLQKFNGQSITFQTPDGATIYGAFFPGKKYPKKALIFIGGNAEQWEGGRWLDLFQALGISILTMNPRGVGKSTGPRTNYSLDAYSACEWLLKKGFDLDDIVFCGFSMGGAITALGAAEIQKKYPHKKVKAININSFSSLQEEIYEISKRMNWIMSPLFKYGSRFLGIELQAESAWNALKGEKWVFYNQTDPVVLYGAQLANAIRKNPIGRNHLVALEPWFDHIPFYSKAEINTFYKAVNDLLQIKPANSSWPFFFNSPKDLILRTTEIISAA